MSRYPKLKPMRSSRRRPRAFVDTVSGPDIAPGAIRPAHSARRRLQLTDVVTNNSVRGYRQENTANFTAPSAPDWTRPGGWNNNTDLRVRVGQISAPLYCDFFGQLGWHNDHATNDFHVRICAVLYTGDWGNAGFHARGEEISSAYLVHGQGFKTLTLLTSFLIPSSYDVTDSRTGLPADWHVGFQVQLDSAVTAKAQQAINRQSIKCLLSAPPFYGNEENDQEGSEWSAPLSRLVVDTGLV